MNERETLLKEIDRRMLLVSGSKYYARNPASAPGKDDFNCIQSFELDDVVTDSTSRGGAPYLKRKFQVAIEGYVDAATEASRNTELTAFIRALKSELYRGQKQNFSNTCEGWKEVSYSRVLSPPVGAHSIGLGILIEIIYLEKIVIS